MLCPPRRRPQWEQCQLVGPEHPGGIATFGKRISSLDPVREASQCSRNPIVPALAPLQGTIRVGSSDDPSAFRPSQDIYTVSAQPWDSMDPALPKCPRMPPR